LEYIMATKFIFICPNCGESELVSAGLDYGFGLVIQPMICGGCHRLVDVLVGKNGNAGLTGDPEYDKHLFLCPLCEGTNLRPWPNNHPCPQCGTDMKNKTDRAIFSFF